MNLCFINPSKDPRPEIYGLASNLKHNHFIYIIQPIESEEEKYKFLIYNSNDIKIYFISCNYKMLFGSLVPLPNFMEAYKMINLLSPKIDHIHCCDYEYLINFIPILRKNKLISTSIVNDSLLGNSYKFNESIMDFLGKYYTDLFGLRLLNSYDKIIFLYEKLRQESIQRGINDKKVFTLPYGVNLPGDLSNNRELEIRKKYNLKNDEKIILFAGRLSSVKRVEYIISITKDLLDSGYKIKTVIIGNGPKRNYLENLAYELNNKVVFTGFIPNEEKDILFKISTFFLLTSISEGLPRVLLEASIFGIPSVATDSNGNSEIIINHKGGYLVRADDYNEYLLACKKLLDDEEEAKKMGLFSKKHVIDNYNWEKISELYINKIFSKNE